MSRKLLVSVLALVACPGDYNDLVTQAVNESVSNSGPTESSGAPTTTIPTTTAPDEPASTGAAEITGIGGSSSTWDSSESSASSTTGAPVEPLWVDIVPPVGVEEIGPSVIEYEASPNATTAKLIVDGEVVDEGPVTGSLVFPVTSDKYNPGTMVTVRVYKDEEENDEEYAEDEEWQACNVKEPGSNVWTALDEEGMGGTASAVALQDGNVVATGNKFIGKVVGVLRRYDEMGHWKMTADGLDRKHTEWTEYVDLKAEALSPSGIAVDSEQAIVVVGTAMIDGEQEMYVARFHPDGSLHWETRGELGSGARGVGIKPDGTIFIAGSQRVSNNPPQFDLRVWVYDADGTAYGYVAYKDSDDIENKRDEFGRAVTVLADGRVVVAGMGEIRDPEDQSKEVQRGLVLLFQAKGVHVGTWLSPGDPMKHDAILAAVTTPEGFATCGYGQDDPNSKKQILVRWHEMDLEVLEPPRLELTPGDGVCNALGYNLEGDTIVGATVDETWKGQGENGWIFAIKGASSPLTPYAKRNGLGNGNDHLLGLRCEYMCAWAGTEQAENGTMQWIVGMIRG
jgi:hypothetical protein